MYREQHVTLSESFVKHALKGIFLQMTLSMKMMNNCERIGLPIPVDDDSQLNDGPTQEQQHEIDFNILNNEQRQLIDSAILAVESSVEEDPTHPKCLYVDAPGGSGKTFVFNMIANYLRQNRFKVSYAAWTATLLTEGRTVHSLFNYPCRW